jgi:hypothetical protein
VLWRSLLLFRVVALLADSRFLTGLRRFGMTMLLVVTIPRFIVTCRVLRAA